MHLSFKTSLAERYASPSQKIRVLTEHWVDNQVYCPSCGHAELDKYGNNRPVADFFCSSCKEDYELKSKKESIGKKIADGAFRTMIERLRESHNPNLFILNYDLQNFNVQNLLVIPKHFFIPEIIEKRIPLASTARRAGWVGCNILLNSIPTIGKIFLIKNRRAEPKNKVLSEWKKTLFLREEKEFSAKGWLLDTMLCIDRLAMKKFTLNDLYKFEKDLDKLHPNNKHIKDKIRQQLQILRDKGYLDFIAKGKYRLIN
ncbi:MAG: restriction endonuclease [Parcubacteria group bacterium]|nr:MAG: restriction endonuclease [Parcubacteria group bacterium]